MNLRSRLPYLQRVGAWEPSKRLSFVMTACTVAIGFVTYVWRRPGLLSHAVLFAEDGQVFFLGSLREGMASITKPYGGYLVVGQRLLALLARFLPVAWTPTTFAVLASMASVASCAIALRSGLRWAFGGWTSRACVFIALLLIPQVTETHGTLTNVAWWGGIGLLLIALSDDPTTEVGFAAEMFFVVIVILTAPIGMVMAPMILWRLRRVRTRWTRALTAAWLTGCAIQVLVLLTSDREAKSVSWSGEIGAVFFQRWFGPFTAGSRYVERHLGGLAWSRGLWLATLVFASAIGAVALRAKRRGAAIVVLAVGTLHVIAGFLAMGPLANLLPDRYTVGSVAAVVLVVALARPTATPLRALRWALIGFLLIGMPRNFVVPGRPGASFDEAGRCLEKEDTTCPVPVVPEIFSLTIGPNDR